MTEFPFQLLVTNNLAKDKEEFLTCTALLRAIAGRRQVYDAMWGDRAVILKIFSDKISARRHLNREWRGLRLLQERGLNSPEPLFYGQTKDGHRAMVTEKVADCSTALDVFCAKKSKVEKLEMLINVCRELAKQHEEGVLQKDLHLGNFLVKDNKVFALDAGQMRFLHSKANKKMSISQLAKLACFLQDSETESISQLCREYAKSRGWEFDELNEKLFQRQFIVHRKRGIRNGLKKCLRTNQRHLKIKSDGRLAVFNRDFCKGAEPADFIKQIDVLMDEGEIIKKGNTCYVSYVRWNNKDAVVKRYNHKGFIHSLRHTMKRSRARRGWLNGHRLVILNIATPKPLCYIEEYKGPLVWRSYLVTEYVHGQKLYDFIKERSQPEHSKVILKVKELLERLGKYRITHGDLKHTNILITENGPILTDLDGMSAHRWKCLFNLRRKKDFARLETQHTYLAPHRTENK